MKELILPEIISVGIYNARLALKRGSVTRNRKTTMFEIELPLEDGGISFIDNETSSISTGRAICAKPGQIRHTRLPFKCYYVHLIAKSGRLCDLLSQLPNFIELKNTERIKEIFEEMKESFDSGSKEEELRIHSLLLELVYLLRRESSFLRASRKEKSNNREVIEKTVEYVKSNLTEDLSLERLAAEAKFTPTYFHKLFKASTGKPLRDYIEEQRIKKAVNLLISTDKTLTEIAYECGFSSQSYFSYAFKRKMKIPPREYAKRLQKEYDG